MLLALDASCSVARLSATSAGWAESVARRTVRQLPPSAPRSSRVSAESRNGAASRAAAARAGSTARACVACAPRALPPPAER